MIRFKQKVKKEERMSRKKEKKTRKCTLHCTDMTLQGEKHTV
jgi:hypothetical protein